MIADILTHVYTAVVMLVLFGFTVFIHELGHFLAARRFGMRADVFSIGFGPAIWKKKVRGVVYKIAWFPFGGYVALPQMEPGATERAREDGEEALPWVAPWKKIVVALAGPAGNIVFAFVLACVIYFVGKPASPKETTSVVGYVATNSVAYQEGIRPGHVIERVNGDAVSNWQQFQIIAALEEEVELDVRTNGTVRSVHLPTEKGDFGIRRVPGLLGAGYCKVLSTTPGSSADEAGIRPGDLIVSFNGVAVHSRPHLSTMVNSRQGEPTPIHVVRDGETVQLEVTPRYNEQYERALIGVQFNTYFVDVHDTVHPTPITQMKEHLAPIFRILRALVTPRSAAAAADSIGGPPAILMSLWIIIQNSFMMALWFTGFLNVNLAILNLLPLPVLDGGHILFSLWEVITRRPVHERVLGVLTYIFAVLLIGLMLFLTFRDVNRFVIPFFSDGGVPAAESTNQPPAAAP